VGNTVDKTGASFVPSVGKRKSRTTTTTRAITISGAAVFKPFLSPPTEIDNDDD
jgi:hypothetical protein